MPHPVLTDGRTAVVTGGAAGIGLAAAKRLAGLGMNVVLADLGPDRLERAATEVAQAGSGAVMTRDCDVADPAAIVALEQAVTARFGRTDLLMNNAGIQPGSAIFGPLDDWQRVMAVNLWGVIHGCRTFAPAMIADGKPGLIVNTGSKQGITCPPGDPAYNMAKAGVKVFTEALQHELRNTPGAAVTAHLLIPGFVYTDLTRGDRTEKPDAAWTPEQTADFMIDRLVAGDFYILCPDNDVPRPLDEKRIAWAAADIIENRPPLSRWHPDWDAAFKAFVERI